MTSPLPRGEAEQTGAGVTAAAAVVLDYCAAVRGILNNDQGGPLGGVLLQLYRPSGVRQPF